MKEGLTMTSKALSSEMLEELESTWRRAGAPIAERLLPGLTDAQIDAMTGEIALELPAEPRLWGRWHDGCEHQGLVGLAPPELGPSLPHVSLAEAVEHYRDGDVITVNTAPSAASSIHRVAFEDPHLAPIASSFGELIALWIRAIETGVWEYDPSARWWRYEFAGTPPDLRAHPYF
jgi:hypothetical protein